jgi:O-acetyl-ADP-ribose deacetylase (regulator of RNase III)
MRHIRDREVAALSIGRVQVVVTASRIETAARDGKFDALVSSDDTSLSMSGGVSKAILDAAGPTLKQEANRLLPVRVGDVVVTSAGMLPVRYVFHAVTTNPQHGVRPTVQTIRLIGRTIFGRCEEVGVARIAVPLIGTGAAAVPTERSAKLVLESLAEHARNPTGLQAVVFCIPDDEARRAFLVELKLLIRAGEDVTTGVPILGATSYDGVPKQDHEDSVVAPARRLPKPGAPLTADRLRNRIARLWRWPLRRRSIEDSLLGDTHSIEQLERLLEALKEERSDRSLGEPRHDRTDPEATTVREPERVILRFDQRSRPLLSSRYVLLEEIGRGGMGIVYLAWDVVLRHVIAIKTLHPTDSISRERIERLRHEAALQMRLAHPGIVRLFHFEPWDRSVGPFVIMEYVPWTTGDRWIAEAGSEGLPPHVVVHLGIKLCEALAVAHEAGVLHLDIKPSNVFVDPSGHQPKLGDFGIATALGPKQHDALVTRLIGTPAYMAPEQRARGARVGPWTDVYQLSGTLWELITGERPTERTNNSLTDPARTASLEVLQKGLAGSVDDRPTDARTFATLLTGVLQQPLST